MCLVVRLRYSVGDGDGAGIPGVVGANDCGVRDGGRRHVVSDGNRPSVHGVVEGSDRVRDARLRHRERHRDGIGVHSVRVLYGGLRDRVGDGHRVGVDRALSYRPRGSEDEPVADGQPVEQRRDCRR